MGRLRSVIFEAYLALAGSIPTEIGVKLRQLAYARLFACAGTLFVDSGVTITGHQHIRLGNNVSFLKNSYVYAHDNGRLTIGDNFSMNHHTILGAAGGSIVIGHNCLIGPNTVLRAANHSFDRTDIPINRQGHSFGEIVLEDDVWIGSNCFIAANTRIGTGSIIAAGSVVTKDVEPYSVVAGVPAKLIRKRGPQGEKG